MSSLLIHSLIHSSRVNGPGDRFVIWTQGCTKGCLGCFNPSTWKTKISSTVSWDPLELAKHVLSFTPYGLTLTGGDPLEQPEALLEFLEALHVDGKLIDLPGGIICFSGYTLEEIEKIESARECLKFIDLLIDGRYVRSLRIGDVLAGSSNQRFHFSNIVDRGKARIPEDSIVTDQAVEFHLGEGKSIEVTGFPDIDKNRLKALGIKILP